MRSRPEWPLMRLILPDVPHSAVNPAAPVLGDAAALEAALLRLPDDAWRRFSNPVEIPRNGGPVKTGDPVVDEWERKLFEGGADV